MAGHIEIDEDNIYELINPKINELFTNLKINKGVGIERKHSFSIITVNKEIAFKGAFPMGELKSYSTTKEKYYKYIIAKGTETPFGLQLEKSVTEIESEIQYLNTQLNYSDFKACMGIDIATGEYYNVDLMDQLHTMILGGTGSGKSVLLKFLLIQILQNKYSELYIIDKVDFQCLEGTAKCRYRGIFENMTAQDFFAFKNYFLLEYARRQKIFKENGVDNYDEYKALMLKDDSLEKLNYIYILIDEFQTLRTRIAQTIDVKIFDDNMKQLLDTVRSTGMCFYFGTQDYLKGRIGETRTAIRNFFFGKMDNADLRGDDLAIVKDWIKGTYLFYYPALKKILKIPHGDNTNELLREASNNPNNRIKENENYTSLPEMVNAVLDITDSDIFSHIDGHFKLLNISDDYISRLKLTTEYIPFSVLIYVILRDFKLDLINGKNTDIFKAIDFPKAIDKVLWSENILMYKTNAKLLQLLDGCFELGQNGEEFIDALSDVINNYLKGILGSTKITFGEEPTSNEKKKDNITLLESKDSNITKNNNLQEVNTNNQFTNKQEYKDDVMIQVGYTGEIKPVSFNSMYYIDKLAGIVRKSSEATKYEKTIKDRITNKMIAKSLKQTREPVILEIVFTLGIQVKKNGELSKVGRNDLDNLLKATIDGINSTIINDDKQVFGIKTKINYIEKQSSIYKNNNVNIKVIKITPESYKKYRNIFSDDKAITPLMNFSLDKELKIKIPSVNDMYFISEGKKKSSSNTIGYKNLLKNLINEYKSAGNVHITDKDVLIYLEFSIHNTENRDLDNMLKATIDSLQGTIIENDSQVREIMCFKTALNESAYSGKINAQIFNYNPIKDIQIEVEPNSKENIKKVLMPDGTLVEQKIDIVSNNEKEEIKIEENIEIDTVSDDIPNGEGIKTEIDNNFIKKEDNIIETKKEDNNNEQIKEDNIDNIMNDALSNLNTKNDPFEGLDLEEDNEEDNITNEKEDNIKVEDEVKVEIEDEDEVEIEDEVEKQEDITPKIEILDNIDDNIDDNIGDNIDYIEEDIFNMDDIEEDVFKQIEDINFDEEKI